MNEFRKSEHYDKFSDEEKQCIIEAFQNHVRSLTFNTTADSSLRYILLRIELKMSGFGK